MWNNLKRDASKVSTALVKKGEVVYAAEPCKIYFPKRWEGSPLANLEGTVTFLGVYAIVANGHYAVDTVPAMMISNPLEINTVTVDGEDLYELSFDKGAEVLTTKVIKNKLLLYEIDLEFNAKGRVPKYLDYEDPGRIFVESAHYAGARLGANIQILAMVAMTLARSPKDGVSLYRHTIKDKNTLSVSPPTYVGLRNIGITASNTTAKLLGSYFDPAVNSALVNPSTKNEGLEDLLRGVD